MELQYKEVSQVTRVIVLRSNFSENRGNSLQVSNSESVTINGNRFYNN